MTQTSNEMRSDDSDEVGSNSSINWMSYIIALRERLWLILFCFLVGTGIAYYQAQEAVPIFAARCTVSAERPDRVLTGIQSVKNDLADNSWATSIVETMNSPELVSRVNERLSKEYRADRMTANQNVNLDAGLPWFLISARGGTSMIDVIAEHTNPQLASLWANGMVDEYQLFRNEAVAKATTNANKFLVDEAARIREKLTKSEIALQEYRENKGAASLEKEQDVVISRFRELSNQYNSARDKRSALESDIAKAEKLYGNPDELAKLTSVASAPSVVALSQALDNAERQMLVVKQRFLYKHPKYKAIEAEINSLKARKNEEVINASKSLQDYYANAVAHEKRMKEELDKQEKDTYVLGKLQVDYDKLKREIEADRVIYDQVITRLKETDLTKGLEELQNSPLRILQSATPSSVPVRPDKKKMILSGVFGGLSVGICIALGLFLLDGSFHTVDEVEKAMNLPVLAAVSMRKTVPSHWVELPLLDTVRTIHGPISESFRALRTALILLGRDKERKVIMVTSALPGEGKSFTAANLAVTFAQQNLRTLLIDLDLRKPTVGKTFFEISPEKGATDVLSEQVRLSRAIVESPVSNLDILACGSRAPNPSELLSSGTLPKLLEDLDAIYDRIVIDTPPVIPVSDALLICSRVDCILQVVRANKTPRIAVQRACHSLTKAAGKAISGVVLNQLPQKSRGYYYSYSYSDHYGDKGVYGAPS